MLRKQRLVLALWLAPALAFRALIPSGFMLEPVDGHTEIVLCGSDAPAAAHQHRGQDHAGDHHSHADPTCPYAQAAGPAPLPAIAALFVAPMASVFVLPVGIERTHAHFGPTRQQSARAPPRLA